MISFTIHWIGRLSVVNIEFYHINFKLVQELNATCVEFPPTPDDCITYIKTRGRYEMPQNNFSSNVTHANHPKMGMCSPAL